MTAKQNSLYWREWGTVRGYAKAKRLPEPDRHAFHVQALGADKSHQVFSNADFDKVLGAFRAYHQPANIDAQLRQQDQPHKRKLAKVRELLKCLALYLPDAHAYARGIIRDKVNRGSAQAVTAIEDLSDEPRHYTDSEGAVRELPSQLEQLLMTLERALNGKHGFRARAGDSLHDMKLKAGVKCYCASICCPPRRPALVAMNGGEIGP